LTAGIRRIARCSVLIGCILLYAPLALASHFYFAQVTDTHFGSRDHLVRSRQIVQRINALPMKIACVVHTGDIVADQIEDKKLVTAVRAVMDSLDVPLHYVPGNHDIPADRLQATLPVYREAFGNLIESAKYNGVVFLFVYTEPLRKNIVIEGYRPLEALRQHLERAEGNPVIVFHHAPSVKNFYNNTVHSSWQAKIRRQWIALLNAYNVKAVIAGHFHRDEFHWLGKVPLYIAPPVAGFWGRQASYRIYEYRDGRVSYTTQYIE
jgi:predicted phosphodiesterase